MIRLTQDRRAMREGYTSVYVIPDEIAAIVRNSSLFDEDNKTVIVLKTGEKIAVQGYPDSVADAIDAARKEAQP